MGTRVYGPVATEQPDNVGEKILIDGLEDRLKFIRDEHDSLDAWRTLGSITKSKKIYGEKDCEDEKQLRCWRHVGAPFLYAEGELADEHDHPNAKAAASLLKFVHSTPNCPLMVGFSVDGGIAERRDESGQVTEDKERGKILSKTVAISAALTVKPANSRCRVFLENDLQKSVWVGPPPAGYYEALKKSQSTTSINEILTKEFVLWMKLEGLKKSLSDYLGGFTSLKCQRCAKSVRFFKATKDMPNCCDKCGSNVSLSQVWQALNK